jgi:acyl-CoA thioester hydrolase
MSEQEARPGARGPETSAFKFWTPVSVRYSDLDEQGRVNNAVFMTYFEQGRIGYFDAVRKLGRAAVERGSGSEQQGGWLVAVAPGASDDRLELPLVISEAHLVYHRPVASLAPISVGVRTSRLGHASLVIEYAVCDVPHGVVYATGDTKVACVDLKSGRPRGLPRWTIEAVRELEGDTLG